MRKNGFRKRMLSVLFAGILTFLLAACGKEAETGINPEDSENGGFEYAARFYDLPYDAEADSVVYSGVSFAEGRLYYIYSVYTDAEKSSEWCYVDTANPEAKAVTVLDLTSYETGGGDSEISVLKAAACGDGGTVLLLQTQPSVPQAATEAEYARRQRDTTYSIKKLAEDGTELFDTDITEYLHMDRNSINSMVDLQIFTDKESTIYVSDKTSYVWAFDKEGNHTADIRLSGVQGLAAAVNLLPDGRLGVLRQGNGMQIEVYDPDTGQLSETHTNLPSGCNSGLEAGWDGGILLNGNGNLYEYSMSDKEYKELIKWADCGVNEEYIRQMAALTDGRIAVYSSDWNTNANTLILVEGAAAPRAAEKEVLTLGCTDYASPFLRAAVAAFNKTGGHYKIEIKMYKTHEEEEARMLLYSDILTGNAPDMFVASDIDISLFAVKGLLADLSPYLDSSEVVQREDLFETMLNAYTVDNILCAIPVRAQCGQLKGSLYFPGTLKIK